MTIKTFQDYIDAAAQGHMLDIMQSQSPEFQGLLTQGCAIFERFSHSDQLTAMACMVGMILGTVEGERLPEWEKLSVMITHKERLHLFQTQALVVFWDAMDARGRPVPREPLTMGKPRKLKAQPKVKGARVLQIVSGKRKKVKHG